MPNTATDYIKFQSQAASPYHVVQTIENQFKEHNFSQWQPGDKLQSGPGWTKHWDGKAIIAWNIPKNATIQNGFAIAAAHVDSPTLRLKLDPFRAEEFGGRLLTQLHGGLIQRSWLDRPLQLGGKLWFLKEGNKKVCFENGLPATRSKLVSTDKPIAVIPDVAIHLDPQKNKDGKINAETMLSAVFGCEKLEQLLPKFWKTLKISSKEHPIAFDLTLSPAIPHMLTGVDESLIVGPRHDDLAMVFSILQAITKVKTPSHKIPVAIFVDAEETGSTTASGADSAYIRDTLFSLAQAISSTATPQDLHKSFLISADMAHAWHPGYPHLHDTQHKPHINQGIVIKENANDRYATSGFSTAIIRGLCKAKGLNYQNFVTRQDMGCGSTIGPTLSAALSCATADIGIAQWAMHSAAETMGLQDLVDMTLLLKAFFSKSH